MTPVPAIASPAARARPWARWWTIAAAWWLLSGLVTALARAPGRSLMHLQFAQDMTSAALWIPVTVLAFWLADRGPGGRDSWRSGLPLAVAAALTVVGMRAAFVLATNPVMHWYAATPNAQTVLLHSVANNFLPFFLLLAAAHALVYAQRLRERDELLARAELQHLKAQLQPHFLFNALNAISSSVHLHPDLAVQMIARLSTLLRHALQQVGAQDVPLEEELVVVAAYVELEQLRFEERLRVEWQVASDVRSALVPHLLLQPLVENAIKHGLAPQRDGGTIRLAAMRAGDRLRLVVADDGVGLPPEAPDARGIGLTNVRERLRQLYGAAHLFSLRSLSPHGLEVEVQVPFRAATSAGLRG